MNIGAETDELIARWVKPNPHHPEIAEAWILPGHVSAWVVVGQFELDHGDLERVADAYDLPVEAVKAAMRYYSRHKEEIDARIARNRAFFGS